MANIIEVQTINDGQRNYVAKWTAQLDSSDESYVVKVNPATLSSIQTQGNTPPTKLAVYEIQYVIEDGLVVNLWWDVDGTQPNAKLMTSLAGRGKIKLKESGWWPNNAAGGGTGKIALSTEGWQAGSVLSYTLDIWAKKS